jgi:argininosuccinate synthase
MWSFVLSYGLGLDTVVVIDWMRQLTMLMQEQTLLVEYATKGTASPRCRGAVSGVSFISNLTDLESHILQLGFFPPQPRL